MIDGDRAARAEGIFHKARSVPESARRALIEGECGPDRELLDEVLGLLKFDGGWTDVAASRSRGPGCSMDPIGPYTLRSPLGEGAMGRVFLAEQTEPLRRTVALKIVKPGMDSSEVLARFEAERQVLCMLDHPNVARVLDAGATPDGLPYFVMELVQGVSITEHCERAGVGLKERLELFIDVCEAVHHAHQKGIIHRDIKPSNVLVALHDNRAIVKVIDFGVAKALHPISSRPGRTEQGQIVGTPEYMSPEQADLTAQDIDTRSDVYSLGVLLYQLVTGDLPLDSASLRSAGLDGARRMIREFEPVRPSQRIRTSTGTRREAAVPGAAALARRVRTDLDWIVLKALEKDRRRRYGSASDFAADVRRFLADEPIAARPPSTSYLATKFIRRHRIGVAASAMVISALVIGLAVAAWQGYIASQQRAKAEQEQRMAQAVFEFLSDMLTSADPDRALGKELRVRALLQRAAIKLRTSPPQDPLVGALLNSVIGRTFLSLAMYPEAQSHLSAAIESLSRLKGSESVEAQRAMADMVDALRSDGQLDSASTIAETAHAHCVRAFGEDDPRTLTALAYVATVRHMQARFEEAERMHRRVFEGLSKGPFDPRVISPMVDLAMDLHELGRTSEAEPLLREALKLVDKLGPDRLTHRLRTLNNLANILEAQGRFAEAHTMYTSVLEEGKADLSPDHPLMLTALHNLARVEEMMGRYAEAEVHERAALEGFERVLGSEHPSFIQALSSLAVVLQRQNKLEESEALHRRSVELREKTSGPEHPETLAAANNLGSVLGLRAKYDEAAQVFARVLVLQVKVRGEKHPATITTRHNLAFITRKLGKLDEALPMYKQACDDGVEVLPAGHFQIALFRGNYAECLSALGRTDEAEPILLESYKQLEPAFSAEHFYTKRVAGYLCDLYRAKGNDAAAAPWCTKAGK